ncbi:MAG TPA: hypothetical protein VGG07_25455 [Solirubrobacteraceae bacterium]
MSRPDASPVTWMGALLLEDVKLEPVVLELLLIDEVDISTLDIGPSDDSAYGA